MATTEDLDMPALSPDDEAAPPSRSGADRSAEARKSWPLWLKITIIAVPVIVAAIVARTVLKADGKTASASTSAAAATEKKADAKPAPTLASEAASETGLPAWYSKEVTPWATAFTSTVNNHDALLNGTNGTDGLVKQIDDLKAKNATLDGELKTMSSRLEALEGRIASPATSP